MNLALLTGTNLFANTAGQDPTVAAYILTGIAFAQFIGLILFKLFSVLKQNGKMMACLHKEQPVRSKAPPDLKNDEAFPSLKTSIQKEREEKLYVLFCVFCVP